ncbi:hypothetical protein THASP1DRAFT_23568, partial [Thamnocephalis sphaerospora]
RDTSLRAILTDAEFWCFWIAAGLVTGVDLMYVNNIGLLVQQLWPGVRGASGVISSGLDDHITLHVSVLSFSSCIAGLLVGYASDYAKRKANIERIHFFTVAAALQGIAQVGGYYAETLEELLPVTFLSGFASGIVFTLNSVVVSDYWGTENCGRNIGLIGWAVAFGSQIFGSLFGVIYDMREGQAGGCMGRECYRDVFPLSAFTVVTL